MSSTVTSLGATRATMSSTRCIAGLAATIVRPSALSVRSRAFCIRSDRASTAFLDELQELEQQIPGLRLLLTMTEDAGWDGESRFVGPDLLNDHLEGGLADHTYLVAGPPAMVEAVAGQLTEAGVPEEQVLPDRFSGY